MEPYQGKITIACESTFNWYFLADYCEREGYEFVIGHALYMKHIHGGKAKNDRIDAKKIADLLRVNLLPVAYAYPAEKRSVRDLMRRRGRFVKLRGELAGHLPILAHQYNLGFEGSGRKPEDCNELLDKLEDPYAKLNAEADIYLLEAYNETIHKLELEIRRFARKEVGRTFKLLKSVPGCGDILALTLLYEIDTINRFDSVKDFASYARLIKCRAESAGKSYGFSGTKIGNAHLKWAFGELAVYAVVHDEYIRCYFEGYLLKKYSRVKAYSCLAHKLGRGIYNILKRDQSFDYDKFFVGSKASQTRSIVNPEI